MLKLAVDYVKRNIWIATLYGIFVVFTSIPVLVDGFAAYAWCMAILFAVATFFAFFRWSVKRELFDLEDMFSYLFAVLNMSGHYYAEANVPYPMAPKRGLKLMLYRVLITVALGFACFGCVSVGDWLPVGHDKPYIAAFVLYYVFMTGAGILLFGLMERKYLQLPHDPEAM